MRTLYRTPEFDEFYEALDERVKTKYCSPQITLIKIIYECPQMWQT